MSRPYDTTGTKGMTWLSNKLRYKNYINELESGISKFF
jgi:hypothetical protein